MAQEAKARGQTPLKLLGPILATLGALLSIAGGIILFLNTPPDVGGTHMLMIPQSDGGPSDLSGDGPMQDETRDIQSRRTWSRIGFALLTAGAVIQLAGYWADKLS